MRLIDADELLRKLPREELVSRMIVAGMSTINPVLRDLENGITYAPVKRGRWIDTGSGQECSVCHEIQYGYDNYRYYCPNCGAKMEENNG